VSGRELKSLLDWPSYDATTVGRISRAAEYALPIALLTHSVQSSAYTCPQYSKHARANYSFQDPDCHKSLPGFRYTSLGSSPVFPILYTFHAKRLGPRMARRQRVCCDSQQSRVYGLIVRSRFLVEVCMRSGETRAGNAVTRVSAALSQRWDSSAETYRCRA
jgi:hypothetical protein